jgi:hypothetical protein
LATSGWNAQFAANLAILEAQCFSRRPVTLGEAVAAYDSVCIHSDGKAYKAKVELYGHRDNHTYGIALEAGAADATIHIQTEGKVTNPAWIWKMGLPIFVGHVAGALKQSAPARGDQILGWPVSATTIYLEGNIDSVHPWTTTTTTSSSSSTTTTTAP